MQISADQVLSAVLLIPDQPRNNAERYLCVALVKQEAPRRVHVFDGELVRAQEERRLQQIYRRHRGTIFITQRTPPPVGQEVHRAAYEEILKGLTASWEM